jgi:hypothetical protein
MKNSAFSTRTFLVGTLSCTFALMGAECLNAPLNVPFDLESPPAEANVTEQVESIEDGMCEDATSRDCLVIMALDATDGTSETPPRVPNSFPKVVEDPTNPGTDIDVAAWFADPNGDGDTSDGMLEAARVKQSADVNIAEEVDFDASQIQSVSIDSIAMNWTVNTLTFPTAALDLYISPKPLADHDACSDSSILPEECAEALLAAGEVTKIGTLPAQPGGATGEAPIEFVGGGKDALNDAVKTLHFTMVVAVPDETDLSLPEDPNNADNLLKPMGESETSMKATLLFTITAADVAGAVQ